MDEHEQEKIQELEMKLHKDHRGVISTSDFQDPEAIYKRMIQRIRMYHPNTNIRPMICVSSVFHVSCFQMLL